MPATNQDWTDQGRLNGAFQVRQTAPFEDDVALVPVTERGFAVAQERTTRIARVPALERIEVAYEQLRAAVRERRFEDALTLARGEG